MQQEAPWMIPGYTYSEDSDAEDNGQDRVQPGIEAILANTQPRCARYFRSGTCTDYLIAACPGFRLRYTYSPPGLTSRRTRPPTDSTTDRKSGVRCEQSARPPRGTSLRLPAPSTRR